MNLVNWAGSVSKNLPHHFLISFKTKFSVIMRCCIDMVTETLVFTTKLSAMGIKFSQKHSSPGNQDETFLTK